MTAFSASFQCDDCGKTYPGRKQQSDDEDTEKCPDCYEESSSDDEDDEEFTKHGGFVRNRSGGSRDKQGGGHPWDQT